MTGVERAVLEWQLLGAPLHNRGGVRRALGDHHRRGLEGHDLSVDRLVAAGAGAHVQHRARIAKPLPDRHGDAHASGRRVVVYVPPMRSSTPFPTDPHSWVDQHSQAIAVSNVSDSAPIDMNTSRRSGARRNASVPGRGGRGRRYLVSRGRINRCPRPWPLGSRSGGTSPGARSRSSRRRGDRRRRRRARRAARARLAEPRRPRGAARRLRSGTGPAVARAPAGPLGAAPDPRRRGPEPVGPVHGARRRRPLAGRAPCAVAGLVGRPLGARRRRLGRGRREPGRHDGPRAARGVVGRARAAADRGARAAPQRARAAGRPGVAGRRRRP